MNNLMLSGAPTKDPEVCSEAVQAFMRVSAQYLGVTHVGEPLSTDSRCLLAALSAAGRGPMYFDHQALLQQTENRS